MYTYVYIHMYKNSWVFVCWRVCVRARQRDRERKRAFICVYVRVSVSVPVPVCIRVCRCVCMGIHTHTNTHTNSTHIEFSDETHTSTQTKSAYKHTNTHKVVIHNSLTRPTRKEQVKNWVDIQEGRCGRGNVGKKGEGGGSTSGGPSIKMTAAAHEGGFRSPICTYGKYIMISIMVQNRIYNHPYIF